MKSDRHVVQHTDCVINNQKIKIALLFKVLFSLSILLITGLLIQACNPGQTTPTVVGELPAESAQQRKGVLRVAVQPIVQVDPAFISSDPEVLVADQIYDYLVDVDSENVIVPRLATDWKISDDGLTYEFTLAEGVTFHDGSDFTAEDVVWTFNRLRDTQVGSATVDLYNNIVDIQNSGTDTVRFTLAESNPFFLYDLSDNHALMLKSGTQDPSTEFNGTGPFKVVEYNPEDRLVMAANDKYFIPDQPKLAGIEFIFFNDQTAQVEALRSGQVDLVMAISSDSYASLRDQTGITLLEVATNGFDLIRLRSDRPPGNDPRIMQALKLATDRQAIYQLVLQGFGEIGRDSPVGPLYRQYYSEDTPLPERDVEAARSLLTEAGYPEGIQLTLHTPDTGNRPNLAVVLKEQWAEAGIDVDVVVEPESVYYGEDGWLEVDLGITGWGSRPYPQFYLDVMLTCGAKWNESHYCDQEFDELAAVAGTTQDEVARVQAYAEIQRILIERGPVLIPYFFAQLGAINDEFKGFQMKAFPGRSDFRVVTFIGE
jgi:peptide/nickel transport system substrate-binding protein